MSPHLQSALIGLVCYPYWTFPFFLEIDTFKKALSGPLRIKSDLIRGGLRARGAGVQ